MRSGPVGSHSRFFNRERGTSNLREELAMTLLDLITNSCRFVAATFFAVLLVSNSQQTSAQDRSMHVTRTDSGGSKLSEISSKDKSKRNG